MVRDYTQSLYDEFGMPGTEQYEASLEEARAVYTGQLIRDTRKEAKVTQSELAKKLSVTKSYISRIENGLITPSVTVFYRIMDALGMEIQINKRIATI